MDVIFVARLAPVTAPPVSVSPSLGSGVGALKGTLWVRLRGGVEAGIGVGVSFVVLALEFM